MANYVIAKYIRLSIEDAKSDSQSIENQRSLLDAHIQTLEVQDATVLEFVDNGYSGTNFSRPGVQEMLALAQTGQVHCIIFKDISRFGRDSVETGYYLERVFPRFGVRVLSLADGYDSNEHQEDSAGLMLAFKSLMAEYYSRDLSKKISSAARERMARGERISKRCVFGYRKDSDKLVIDREASITVKRIFHLAEAGSSMKDILRILYEEKHLTPTAYRGERDISEHAYIWTDSVVHGILRNEQYTGMYIAGKCKVEQFGSKKQIPVPEEEWIKIPNHHEAIISRELFEAVQRPKKSAANTTRRKSAVPAPLQGKAICGHCGHALSKSGRNYCCTFTKYAPEAKCHNLRISGQDLEAHVLAELQALVRDRLPQSEGISSENVLQNDRATLYEALILGDISEEQYKAEKAKLDVTKAKRKEALPLAPSHSLESLQNAKQLTRELVELFLDKVCCFSEGELTIHPKI